MGLLEGFEGVLGFGTEDSVGGSGTWEKTQGLEGGLELGDFTALVSGLKRGGKDSGTWDGKTLLVLGGRWSVG